MKSFGNLYLDTNILRGFKFKVKEDPRFEELKKYVEFCGTSSIFIPTVVYKELHKFHMQELVKHLRIMKKSYDVASKFIPITFEEPDLNVEDLVRGVKNKLDENYKEADIKVFELNKEWFDIDKLVDLSIEEHKPFSGEGKGFNDTVIIISILNHIKQVSNEEHLFVTENKKDFNNEDIKKLIEEHKVNLRIFNSIDELTIYLDSCMEEDFQKWLKEREEKLLNYLNRQKDKISEFIKKENEFSEPFIMEGQASPSLTLRKIIDIELAQIFSPKISETIDEDTRITNVSFKVRIKFIILASRYEYTQKYFKVGETDPSQFMPELQTVAVESVGNASSVQIDGNIKVSSRGDYSDLVLEKITEVPELSTALMSAMKYQGGGKNV